MLCVHEISAADIFLIYCIVFYTACLPDEPDIWISGKDEVICGNSVEFKANIDHSEFLFLSITWQKRRGENIRCIDISEEKYSGSTNSKLLIRSACKGDEGEYSAFLSIESNWKKYHFSSCCRRYGFFKIKHKRKGLNQSRHESKHAHQFSIFYYFSNRYACSL